MNLIEIHALRVTWMFSLSLSPPHSLTHHYQSKRKSEMILIELNVALVAAGRWMCVPSDFGEI